MKAIAVQGCQLDCPYATIQTPPKTFNKYGGKLAYAGSLTIVISGYVGQGITNGSGQGTLQPSATHVTIEGDKAVLEGDKVQIQVTGVNAGGSPTTVPVVVTIVNAGQAVVKGD